MLGIRCNAPARKGLAYPSLFVGASYTGSFTLQHCDLVPAGAGLGNRAANARLGTVGVDDVLQQADVTKTIQDLCIQTWMHCQFCNLPCKCGRRSASRVRHITQITRPFPAY